MQQTREVTTERSGRETLAEIDALERQFAQLFTAYRQRVRDQATEVDPSLQPSGYRALHELVLRGPAAAGPLADALGFDRSVLSRQLHQLERLGLVERAPDPADRRVVVVSATPTAVERMQALRDVDRDAFRSRLATWPQDELTTLTRLLAKITAD